MISPWLNMTVKVQRRASSSRNALNEPSYGAEANYPVIYASIPTRIEYPSMAMVFTETGERVTLPESATLGTQMFFEPNYTINPEDRITVLTSDDASIVGQLYIVMSVFPEWGAMGQVHHYIAEIQVH